LGGLSQAAHGVIDNVKFAEFPIFATLASAIPSHSLENKHTRSHHFIMPEAYASHPDYGFPRDFKGYGEKGLVGLKWPNNAKIAVSFVINYEEVRTRCIPGHPRNLSNNW
jgi:hypothetical protein